MKTKRQCNGCGIQFEAETVEFDGKVMAGQRYCEQCIVAHERQRADERSQWERGLIEDAWNRICPPLYRDTDADRLPCSRENVNRVMQWNYGPCGLLLHGETDLGKTRLAFLLLKTMHFTDRKKIIAISSIKFGLDVSSAFTDSSSKAKDMLEKMATVDLLFLDDVGKARLTERVEEAFFHVIEERCSHLLPIIATTNMTGATIGQAMSEDRSAPFVRRLRKFNDCIRITV